MVLLNTPAYEVSILVLLCLVILQLDLFKPELLCAYLLTSSFRNQGHKPQWRCNPKIMIAKAVLDLTRFVVILDSTLQPPQNTAFDIISFSSECGFTQA